jgi:hypothetical protein
LLPHRLENMKLKRKEKVKGKMMMMQSCNLLSTRGKGGQKMMR